MAHLHLQNDSGDERSSERNLAIAFGLNLTFTIIEIIGGAITNSVAIISDAVHDLGDTVAIGLSWYLQRVSKRKSDTSYTYGYKRFSLLGAVVTSMVLIAGAILVLYESVPRLFEPEEVNARGMLILAVIGIVVNGLGVLKLKRGHSLNERAVYLHLLEDVLGWVAVLLGGLAMLFFDVPILDPILSIGITIWILSNIYGNLKKTFKILLQESPKEVNLEALKQSILDLEGVLGIHDIHLWTMDGVTHIMTVHIVRPDDYTTDQLTELKSQVRSVCRDYGVIHPTIEFEIGSEDCALMDC